MWFSVVAAAACGGSDDAVTTPDAALPDAPIVFDARPADAPPAPDAAPDAPPAPDARPGNLSCADRDGGVATPDMITITGRVRQGLINATNAANVKIELLPASEQPPALVTTTTGADGRFTLTIPTGGQPVDGVGRFTKDGFINEWFYPGEPLARSYSGLEGLMGRTSDLDNPLIGLVFGTSYDAQKGLVAVLVLDCDNTPIEGATVTLDPPGEKVLYADGSGFPSPLQLQTSRAGAVFGWNMPVGTIQISGSVGGRALKAHSFKTHQGEISLTLLTP